LLALRVAALRGGGSVDNCSASRLEKDFRKNAPLRQPDRLVDY
jgi:hypothetical protein